MQVEVGKDLQQGGRRGKEPRPLTRRHAFLPC